MWRRRGLGGGAARRVRGRRGGRAWGRRGARGSSVRRAVVEGPERWDWPGGPRDQAWSRNGGVSVFRGVTAGAFGPGAEWRRERLSRGGTDAETYRDRNVTFGSGAAVCVTKRFGASPYVTDDGSERARVTLRSTRAPDPLHARNPGKVAARKSSSSACVICIRESGAACLASPARILVRTHSCTSQRNARVWVHDFDSESFVRRGGKEANVRRGDRLGVVGGHRGGEHVAVARGRWS